MPGGGDHHRVYRRVRQRDVLSNSAIAADLVVSGGAVEKHVASIFTKLGLPPDESDNRRVLAVLHYLGG